MGNEYTVTCSSHGEEIYRGQSKSNYDYYRNGSRQCSKCIAEDNRRSHEAAVRRAEQAAKRERDRVLARQRQLEEQERIAQQNREAERKRKRQADNARLLEERRRQELERERIKQEMLQKSTEEIMEQAEKFESLKKHAKNPFTQYKKLNTLNTVTEIRDKVNKCAYVGAIVSERVNVISADLEQTLGDDYELIGSEMKRYKKYGTEMQSMTDVFVEEFSKVFPSETDVSEMAEDHNESKSAANDADDKQYYQERVKGKLTGIKDAVCKVEAQLFLMEQYYDRMLIDYRFFQTFIAEKKDQLSNVSSTFTNMADLLRKVEKRSVLEGTGDRQKMVFDEEYEAKVHGTQKTGWAMGDAIAIGACAGGGAGTIIGACTGGLPGAIVGCVGGAMAGAAIGALCAWINPEEYKTVVTSTTETVTYVADDDMKVTYKGKDQAKALDDIVNNLESSATYQKLKEELDKSETNASKQITSIMLMKENITEIGETVGNYKSEMKKLRGRFTTENKVSEQDAKQIDKKLEKLKVEIQSLLATMKSK